jgi:hypothetical protein
MSGSVSYMGLATLFDYSEERGNGLCTVPSQNMPRGTEENHKVYNSIVGLQAAYEPETSQT